MAPDPDVSSCQAGQTPSSSSTAGLRSGCSPNLRGCSVQTPYGWGLCVQDEEGDPQIKVALKWRMRGQQRVQCSIRRSDILGRSFCPIGSCVKTAFGNGVVLAFRPEDGMHQVQLWGPLSQGRNRAYLSQASLQSVLPAIAGLPVETEFGPGFCEGIRFQDVLGGLSKGEPGGREVEGRENEELPVASKSSDCILVRLDWSRTAALRPSAVRCPVAMILPLVDRFVDQSLLLLRSHSGTLEKLREALGGLGLEKLQEQLTGHAGDAIAMATRLWQDLEAQDAKSVVDTLKLKTEEVLQDPKMHQVLDASIARLNKLVWSSKGFDGVWIGLRDKEVRAKITDTTVLWHWGEESELEIWGESKVTVMLAGSRNDANLTQDGRLVWDDGDIWVPMVPRAAQKELETEDAADLQLMQETLQSLRDLVGSSGGDWRGSMEETVEALHRLADSHGELKGLFEQVRSRCSELEELKAQVAQTRTGAVLADGHEKVLQRIRRLRDSSLAPHAQRVHKRGQKFLARLSTDRKVKTLATDLFSAVQERVVARWNDATNGESETGGNFEEWVASVKDRITSRLVAHRTVLVESLAGLQLEELDLRQLLSSNWCDLTQIEARLELSLAKAARSAGLDDASGGDLLERFELAMAGGGLYGLAGAESSSALKKTWGTLLSSLSELNIEVPAALEKVLEAQASGDEVDLTAWREAGLKSLDDDSLVGAAQSLVGQSQLWLEQAEKWQGSQTVARVLEHLETEDLERSLLGTLHELKAEDIMKNADGMISSAEARDKLVSHLKDTCLDFILKVLPAIHIEQVTGNDRGCDWEINNINFSDFSFRKENVNITLGDPNDVSGDLLKLSARDIGAHFRNLKVFVKQQTLPYMQAEGTADAKATGMAVEIAFRLIPAHERGPLEPDPSAALPTRSNSNSWRGGSGSVGAGAGTAGGSRSSRSPRGGGGLQSTAGSGGSSSYSHSSSASNTRNSAGRYGSSNVTSSPLAAATDNSNVGQDLGSAFLAAVGLTPAAPCEPDPFLPQQQPLPMQQRQPQLPRAHQSQQHTQHTQQHAPQHTQQHSQRQQQQQQSPPPPPPPPPPQTPSAGGSASTSEASSKPRLRLVMSSRVVTMDGLELTVGETNYAFIINALTYLFADVLKTYACQRIAEKLDEHVLFLVDGLNTVLASCAPYLKKLGFEIPIAAVPTPALAEATGSAACPLREYALRAAQGPPQLNPADAYRVAVPRLASGNTGRPDGYPEELDWADPGRVFPLRL